MLGSGGRGHGGWPITPWAPLSASWEGFVSASSRAMWHVLGSRGAHCVPQGTLIQHLKEHMLHGDMTSGDVLLYYTTVSAPAPAPAWWGSRWRRPCQAAAWSVPVGCFSVGRWWLPVLATPEGQRVGRVRGSVFYPTEENSKLAFSQNHKRQAISAPPFPDGASVPSFYGNHALGD